MSGHGHVDGSNKRIALLISVLALCLALTETMAKSAQTGALAANVEASNLWAFFQAKTVRMTVVRTAGEAAEIERTLAGEGPGAEARAKRIEGWKRDVARWDSEPETGEGRKELAARAKQAEEKSALAMARYHHYEVASAAFQIAIVLASATVITGAALLTVGSLGLGVVGLVFGAIGFFAPHAVHLF